jgi:ATP-dependent helicase/nuclease subunit A
LPCWIEAFFTQKGEQYKTYSSKALDERYPDCAARQQPIIDILEAYVQNKVGAMCRRLSLALARLSAETFRQFQSEKALYGLLDYDDLIYFTEALLSQDQMMAWVRWKLDNGINHLLVDEAQDTSPTQWTLLRKLSDPFFETCDDDEKARTFFAVGDFKQSIYSFQGADPLVFETTTSAIFNAAKAGQKPVGKNSFYPFIPVQCSCSAVC